MRALWLLTLPATLSAQQGTIARLTVTPAAPQVVAGDTLRLVVRALDAAGRPVPNVTIKFLQTGAHFEGAVDSTGLVTGGSPSTIPVTVSAIPAGGAPVVQNVSIEVVPGPAASIAIDAKAPKLLVGQGFLMRASVLSKSGDVRPRDRVMWSAAPATIARVSNDGTVTGVAPGRATITATSGSARATVAVDIVSADVSSMTLTPSSPQGRTGDVIRFSLSVKDAAGRDITGLTPTWLLGPGHGEIGADGGFVGYEAGAYTVSASLGSRSAQTTVTLAPRDVRRPAEVVGSVVRTAFPTAEVWVHPNGKIAYLGTHLGGDRVYVIDVANPAAPKIVDSVIVNARIINDVMTDEAGKVLVITREGADNRQNGIVVATLDNPLKPKIVGEFTQGVTSGVHSAYVYTQPRYGTHVYLTNDATGALHIVDINDPSKPKEVAQWKTPRSETGRTLHDVDVRDGYLYGSWWNDGLVILDIGGGAKGGSPSNPQFVSQYKYDLNALYKQVEAIGGAGFIRGTHTAWRHKNYVFIADEVFTMEDIGALQMKQPSRAFGRLHVVDVSDVNNPKGVAYYEPEYGGVHNVWIAGDTLYMGAYNAGFRAFDISGELRGDLRAQQREIAHVNPSAPNGFIPNTTMTWGVVVKDGIAYVNDFNSGLFLVRIKPKPVIAQ